MQSWSHGAMNRSRRGNEAEASLPQPVPPPHVVGYDAFFVSAMAVCDSLASL